MIFVGSIIQIYVKVIQSYAIVYVINCFILGAVRRVFATGYCFFLRFYSAVIVVIRFMYHFNELSFFLDFSPPAISLCISLRRTHTRCRSESPTAYEISSDRVKKIVIRVRTRLQVPQQNVQ